MTRPARFTVADIARAVKALEKAGYKVAGAEISPEGSIRVLTGDALPANDRGNPLDRLHGS